MNLNQFVNSLAIISRAEHTNRPAAALRHLAWQYHKVLGGGLIARRLSSSVLTDDEPGGVIGLVNMLGLYDYNNMSLLQRLLRPGDLFVDVGANVGAYTLVGSECQDVSVLAFEPNPTAHQKLLRNISLNGRQNVQTFRCALSSSQGRLRMTNDGSAPTNRIALGENGGTTTIEVDVETLDRICAQVRQWPTLIKVDVEGHEPDVLIGASHSLDAAAACIIENGERDAVRRALHGRGWRGPFYYHHRHTSLDGKPQRLAEDAVFIGPTFETRYPEIALNL